MITIRAGNGAIGICLLLLLTGCSREQQDWRSAEAADTIEAYGHFIQRHPESELATQARTRVLQLGEDRDWEHAGSADTVDAYREFIAQHPNGKWAQEARIRIENFSLGEQTGTDAASRSGIGAAGGSSAGGRNRPNAGVPGADVGAGSISGGASVSTGSVHGAGVSSGSGLASPGEAAVPAARLASVPPSAPSSPTASTPTTAARQPSASENAFGIQLGAFSSEAAATNEWRLLLGRFSPELQGLTEQVVAADASSGRIYRLQAVVGDEAQARSICDSLRKRSQGCVAVLPH